MEDEQIVDLYWHRSETAIAETDTKYGGLCYSIAYHVLSNREDSEESVSDTYLAAWNEIPPKRPLSLPAFLSKIVRYISINRWEAQSAQKRGGGQTILALDELQECVDDRESVEADCESKEMIRSYHQFLGTLSQTERDVFVRRYFFLDPIAEISADFGFSQSKVTSMLHRLRGRLRKHLVKEGYL